MAAKSFSSLERDIVQYEISMTKGCRMLVKLYHNESPWFYLGENIACFIARRILLVVPFLAPTHISDV